MSEMWVSAKERLPVKAGKYRVLRRGIGHRPAYEDVCSWSWYKTFYAGETEGCWKNSRGVAVSTVIAWWEDKK